MKPSGPDKHLGTLTMEQYLGLANGMSSTVACRMIALACDYTTDILHIHDECRRWRDDAEVMRRLCRVAIRAESNLARVLTLAAENCVDHTHAAIPNAIRSNLAVAASCRSAICLTAIEGARAIRHEELGVHPPTYPHAESGRLPKGYLERTLPARAKPCSAASTCPSTEEPAMNSVGDNIGP